MNTILFDLDGTLLPMDIEIFTAAYFKGLVTKLAPYGYDAESLVKAVWAGTKAMALNDGQVTNKEAFWKIISETLGERVFEHEAIFDDFYINEFKRVKEVCGFNPLAASLIKKLKSNGYRVALATNPIFPQTATYERISWTGLTHDDFEHVTTYENSSHCKPNPAYYLDVASSLGVCPKDCLMVGNDVTEDMIAEKVGMSVFLLTDCLINKDEKDISAYQRGGFENLAEYLKINL